MLTKILSNLSKASQRRMLDAPIQVKGSLCQMPDFAIAQERKSINGNKNYAFA